ncbi:MAG: flagellar biosynthetic protein FliR [Acidobacteriota bacterium]
MATPLESFYQPLAEAAGLRHGLFDSAALFTLALARWVPVFTVAPFLGSRSAPAPVRMGFAIVMALFLLPWMSSQAPAPLNLDNLAWWVLLLRELALGLLLGFVSGLVFWGGEAGGRFIDSVRGTTVANTLLPQTRVQSSLLGGFYFQLLIVLFMLVGGHRWFLAGMFDSYRLLPPFSEAALGNIVGGLINATADVLVIGVKMIAPALAVVMMLDLVLGVANRMAPQLDVFFVSLSLKSALGALAIGLSIYFIAAIANDRFVQQQHTLDELVERLATPAEAP